jgi:hypothetical protein
MEEWGSAWCSKECEDKYWANVQRREEILRGKPGSLEEFARQREELEKMR